MTIQFITASHNQSVLEANLLRSVIFNKYDLRVMAGFDNVAKAYNKAMEVCDKTHIYIYVHNDVYLPDTFENDLFNNLEKLRYKYWGVLGVAGVEFNGKKNSHGCISDRGREWGSHFNLPHEVDTLDEMLLITKGDFRFDENLPLDFYGADICMLSKWDNRKCYAIDAFCHHNSTRSFGGRTEAFYKAEEYFRNKWKEYLPVATTCSLIEK